MAKYLHIEIPKPCSEEWNSMHSSTGGRFCDSCQKTVIDFTTMSDEQLLNFFTKKKENVCGHFYTDQLDKDIPLPVKRIPWLKYFFQVSLPALLFSYKATAQGTLKANIETVEPVKKKQLQPVLQGNITVKGSISNFDGNPVPYATVAVQGTGKGITTDSNGIFSIQLTGKERWLEITALGYEKKLVEVTGSQVDIQLNITTLENVVVVSSPVPLRIACSTAGGAFGVIVEKSFWSRKETKDSTVQKPVAIDLFPNPVKRNGVLTIHWKNPVSNDQQIILYNTAGVMLLQKTIPVNHSLSQQQMNLDLHAAGYYIIHVIDQKTQVKQTVPIIVE